VAWLARPARSRVWERRLGDLRGGVALATPAMTLPFRGVMVRSGLRCLRRLAGPRAVTPSRAWDTSSAKRPDIGSIRHGQVGPPDHDAARVRRALLREPAGPGRQPTRPYRAWTALPQPAAGRMTVAPAVTSLQ
jgi:hypothetical protein